MSNSTSSATPPPVSSTPIISSTPPTTSSAAPAPPTTSQKPSSTVATTSFSTLTQTTIVSSEAPTTHLITHYTTIRTSNGQTSPEVIVITQTHSAPTNAVGTSASSSSAPPVNSGSSGSGGKGGGLSTAATTAIAVVIPVAVIALLVGLGIFFWRRRKQNKDAEEQRRKEVEDYSYNPNGDPTLPAVGSESGGTTAMTDDHSGYRGWGAAVGVMSNRKVSTTLSGGHTQQLSDSGSNTAYDSRSPGYSDAHSSDPIVHNPRDTMNSDDLGALGVGPTAGNQNGIRRGPSNASSAYSAGGRSEHSDDAPPMPGPPGHAYDYNPSQNYGYSQHGPYGDGTYGGGANSGMPIVQDVSARRNTQIRPGGAYQQGNSGIAQNF